MIVSSGMVPIIRSIMEKLVGKEAASRIDIIANEVDYRPDGSWGIKYRHPENSFGHDKSLSTVSPPIAIAFTSHCAPN